MNILLTTINSRYHHSSFGLRYLYANLEELQPQAQIMEFVLGKNPRDIAESLLAKNPKIIGIGVYIWNTTQVLELVSHLKKIAPEVIVVLGGPEISYETEGQELYRLCDFVVKGEAEFLFRDLCRKLLSPGDHPLPKLVSGPLPNIDEIKFPYEYYSDEDIAHRVIYVEASRGCPYKCEYCLSSLDTSVRNFKVDLFLAEMQKLLDRGARSFKFVDRTFNLSPSISGKIMEFFSRHIDLGLFLHFEMVPDRLPSELREWIKKFPEASLQFEVGVQTWNPVVAANVSRRQDYTKIVENFRFLHDETGVHTHADLIVGLPGETKESFGQGFDALSKCQVDEVQVGILKRLKGTPVIRHDQNFKMVYSDQPPFQILKNKDISFAEMQKLVRFAQFWDLYANSGNFRSLMAHFRQEADEQCSGSLFAMFWSFSEFLTARHGQTHALSRGSLMESAQAYLISQGLSQSQAENIACAPTKKMKVSDALIVAAAKTKASQRQQKHH